MLEVMKVKKVKRDGGWKSLSTGSLSSDGGSPPSSSLDSLLALCDGPVPPPPSRLQAPRGSASDNNHESCMVAVESMESSFAELRSLAGDFEAQTWSGRKPG